MDEQQQLDATIERIGTATRQEMFRKFNSVSGADFYLIKVALDYVKPELEKLIGENAKLKKLAAERSPGGFADAPVADEYAWTERDQSQHDIRMTDDPIYAKWFRKREKDRDAMENGINED